MQSVALTSHETSVLQEHTVPSLLLVIAVRKVAHIIEVVGTSHPLLSYCRRAVSEESELAIMRS